MAKALTWKTADLKRAISSAQAAGLTISAVEIATDGTLRIITSASAPAPDDGDDEILKRRAQRNARKTAERAAVYEALADAADRVGAEEVTSTFAGAHSLTKERIARLFGITLATLEVATRLDMIERSQRGGHARYTEAAVLKALAGARGPAVFRPVTKAG